MTTGKAAPRPFIFRIENELEHETNSEEGWWRLVPKEDIGGWLAANMRGSYRFTDAARFRGGKTGAVKIDRAKRFERRTPRSSNYFGGDRSLGNRFPLDNLMERRKAIPR